MICLGCGAEIGQEIGLCQECRAKREASDQVGIDRDDADTRTLGDTILTHLRQLWDNPQRALSIAGGIFIIAFVYLFFSGFGLSSSSSADFKRPPGVLVPQAPRQAATSKAPWQYRGWNFTPLASFSIRARVLVTARFTLVGGSDISSHDFTLGWGPMSDTSILKKLTFTHGFRFVFWNSDNWPIPQEETIRHASNLHAIAGSDDVARALKRIRVDDLVTFDGYLVAAQSAEGGIWNSSTSRDDTGDGACEVMWIDEVRVEE